MYSDFLGLIQTSYKERIDFISKFAQLLKLAQKPNWKKDLALIMLCALGCVHPSLGLQLP